MADAKKKAQADAAQVEREAKAARRALDRHKVRRRLEATKACLLKRQERRERALEIKRRDAELKRKQRQLINNNGASP